MTNVLTDPSRPAKHVPPSLGHGGLLEEAPALNDVRWLPAAAFPELDELRDEHVRLHEAAFAIAREIGELNHRFEDEDAAHAAALRADARGEEVELPALTSPEARAAALAPLEAKANASREVREEFAHRALATISERHERWIGELDSRDGEDRERVEAAQRALDQAEAQLGRNDQLRVWLERTNGRHKIFRDIPGRHIPFGDLDRDPAVHADLMHTGPELEEESHDA